MALNAQEAYNLASGDASQLDRVMVANGAPVGVLRAVVSGDVDALQNYLKAIAGTPKSKAIQQDDWEGLPNNIAGQL